MKSLAPFYQNRMALIDLASGKIETMAPPHDMLAKGIGGAALGSVMSTVYPDALIFATGPLTGSFAPASGLVTATFAVRDKTAHLALPLGHGAWLRRSGFDLVIVTGTAAKPSVIRCSRGEIEVVADGMLPQLPDRNALRAALLRLTADGLAGLLLADAHPGKGGAFTPAAGGESGTLPGASLLGAAMAAKNILAVSLEGGNPLPPVPVPLRGPLWLKAAVAPESSREVLLKELELATGSPVSLPAGMAFKGAACYHCPSPCLAWVPAHASGHLLAADHAGLAAAITSCGENAGACTAACDGRGMDILATAPLLAGLDHAVSPLDLDTISPDSNHALSPAPPLGDAAKAGLVLGVCPRLVRRRNLTVEDLAAAAGPELAARLPETASLLVQEVYI